MTNKPVKVCYVLSYKYPNYVRTSVILGALKLAKGVELYTAVNSSPSAIRYLQTTLRLIKQRITNHPDVYIFGFRSHEIFWIFRLITIGRPVIFDEFINMQQSLVGEKKILKKDSIFSKLAYEYVRLIHKSVSLILADTNLHAESSSKTYRTSIKKYRTLYVGTDEETFKPSKTKINKQGRFSVFFYGNIEALHGVKHILESAKNLKERDIEFVIVGGKGSRKTVSYISNYIKDNRLDNVKYLQWVPFDKLPEYIGKADVCLGGPFGATPQAKKVITGKTFQFLAMGRPTIVGKIEEEIGFIDRKNCLLVEQGSTDKLTSAIKWAFDNQQKLSTIGEGARKLYQDKFSVAEASIILEDIVTGL